MKPSISGAACLIGAPLVAVLARGLLTPQYQDEADRADSTRYLAELADAGTRNDVGAILGLISAILYVGAALALAAIVKHRMPRLATVGAALTIVGAFGLSAISTYVLVAGRLAEQGDRGAMIAVLDRLNTAPQFSVFFLALLAGAAGSILLAVGLYRSHLVSRAAAIVTGVGGAGLMVTAPGPLTSFVVGGAVLALVGMTWVALGRSAQPSDAASAKQMAPEASR